MKLIIPVVMLACLLLFLGIPLSFIAAIVFGVTLVGLVIGGVFVLGMAAWHKLHRVRHGK